MFINLNAKTEYSVLKSTIKVKDLFLKAKSLGQTATAITDIGTCAAAWDGFKLYKETGIKLIIGIEFYFRFEPKNNEEYFKKKLIAILIAERFVVTIPDLSQNFFAFECYLRI